MPNPRFQITVRPTGGIPPVRLEGDLPKNAFVVDPITRQPMPRDMTAQILSLQYEDDEKKADKLTVSVNNWNLEAFDSPLWLPGSIILASWGYPGRMSPIRETVVQKVKGFQILTIEALAQSALMNKTQRVRTFENRTRSAVVTEIAQEHGYGPESRFIEATTEIIPHIPQARLTDAQFLADLAKRQGFEYYVDFDGLHWHPRRLGQRPLKVYDFYLGRKKGEILSISIENDVYTKKSGGTTLKGIDPITKMPITATADNATVPGTALAATKDLFTGIDARDGTEAATVERDTQTAAVGSSTVAPTTQATPGATQAQASGSYQKGQLAAVKFAVEAIGDPLVLAKTVIELRGAGKALSGRYYVTSVTHKLGGSGGYTMAMKWQREGRGAGGGAGAVKPSGPVNEASPKPPTDPSSIFFESGLEVIDRADGTSEFRDTGGRTQESAPAPADDPTAFYR